jgi:hypothetical protein
MMEGPFDAVVVVTDVALVSRRQRVVPGLVSSVGRVLVLSARDFRVAPRGEPSLTLEAEPVRWNAATLLLHLLGHALGLDHRGEPTGSVMSPFPLDPARPSLPSFSERSRRRPGRLAAEFPEREDRDEGTLSELDSHRYTAARSNRETR